MAKVFQLFAFEMCFILQEMWSILHFVCAILGFLCEVSKKSKVLKIENVC